MTLPYPPPFMDLATLAEHICLGESTIEKHVREGTFPKPTTFQGGKKLWAWKTVTKHLEGKTKIAPESPSDELEEVRNAARKEIARANH